MSGREREKASGHRRACFSGETRSLQEESGEAERLFSQFYARTPLPGDLALSFAQERTVIGTVY